MRISHRFAVPAIAGAAAFLLPSSIWAADVAGPAAEPVPLAIQGHLDAAAGIFRFDFLDENLTEIRGAARINVPVNADWNLELDGQAQSISQQKISGRQGGAFAHIYKRDPNAYAFGAFGGVERFDSDFFKLTQATAGLEAQAYFASLTLYGQGWYSHLSTEEGDTGGVFGARGEVTAYLDANTALTGDVAMAHLDADDGDFAANVYTASARAMHRITDSPIAPFAEARWDYFTAEGGHRTTWSVLGGVRLLFDPEGSTLQSNQRTGPAMDVAHFQYLTFVGSN